MAVRGSGRSPSGGTLWLLLEEDRTPGAGGLPFAPFGGVGCTCGAGVQLEAERQRLASNSHCLGERSEALVHRETELEERAQSIDEGLRLLCLVERELHERRAETKAALAKQPMRKAAVAGREESVKQSEEELERQAAQLSDLQGQATAREEALAQEELELMEERNGIEVELECLGSERKALASQAAALEENREACIRQLEAARREQALLGSDGTLLMEIEQQVGIVRANLDDRELALEADEAALRARQADCEQREAQLLPEHQLGLQGLRGAEERLRELRAREEVSTQQHRQLLQQQRDLGSKEVRISGFENVLRRQGSLDLAAGGTCGADSADEPSRDIEEMQHRLQRLRSADADWTERVRLQQCEIGRLEARVRQLEAAVAGKVRRSASRPEHWAAKVH